MIDAKTADAVLSRITERDLVELALHITSVPAPPGGEGEGAEVIYQWLADEGFAPRRVGLFEDRFNVFAEVPAQGHGPALAFNSHIDTWMHPEDHLIWRDPAQPDFHVGREEGDLLIGNPVVNDKGPMAAWLLAAKAIRDAGVTLVGPLYLTAVPGEIGQEPVDEFQGKRYLSKEVGARYLVNHTPRASFCLCAEATAFRKGWIEAGKAFYKITVYGGPVLYTPYVARPYPPGEHPNAIVRALPLIARLEEWALEYEQRHTYASPGGTVVPRVNVSAIRAGQPWLVLQNPEVCMLYLDIRTVPGQDGGAIRHELRGCSTSSGSRARWSSSWTGPATRRTASSRSPTRSTRRTGTSSTTTSRSPRRPSAACGATTTCSTRRASPPSPTARPAWPARARSRCARRTCCAPAGSTP